MTLASDLIIRCMDEESPLGRWRMHGFTPPAGSALAPYLDTIWFFDGATAHRRERLFPTGRFEIVVQLDAPHRPLEGDLAWTVFPATCITPLQEAPRVIEAPEGRIRVLGIRLTPLGAYTVLGLPLDALGSGTVDAGEVIGLPARRLEAGLHAARTDAERVAFAHQWILDRLARAPVSNPAAAWVCAALDRGSRAPVTALRERTAYGKTAFAATFRREVGTTPKRFAAMVRVRAALEALARGHVSLGDVALHAGFYDQSHMNADFRRYAGLTPGEYVASLKYDMSLSVAESAN